MIHQFVQQIAGRTRMRGFTPNGDHLIGRHNRGMLKLTMVAAAVLVGLSI